MLNTDAYGVTHGTLFLYVIRLPISYKICALWGSGPISNRSTSFLRLTRPTSYHPKNISIQCAIFQNSWKDWQINRHTERRQNSTGNNRLLAVYDGILYSPYWI